MERIVITKDYTVNKAKADVKAAVTAKFFEFLGQEFGEDAVRMLRTGNSSKTNEIGFIVTTGVGEDGEENPVVVTFNPTVKEFSNHKSDKKTYVPFDFLGAAAEYDEYIAEKVAKDNAAKEAKAAKIKRDTAAREKAKEEALQRKES